MAEINKQRTPNGKPTKISRVALIAVGGILGAVAASSCCILPLILFSIGIGGALIGNLATLAPYQPFFVAITFGFLGYGYWLLYRKGKVACIEGAACSQRLPNWIIKLALWIATVLIAIVIAFPYIAPIVLGN